MKKDFLSILASAMVAGFLAPDGAHAYDQHALCGPPAGLASGGGEEALYSIAPTDVPWSVEAHNAPSISVETALCRPDDPLGAAAQNAETSRRGIRERAVLALARSRALASAEHPDRALLSLSLVSHGMPEIADRVAIEQGDLAMAAGPSEVACRAYERALQSPQREVLARARVSWVRCLLETGDRRGESELTQLFRRYPELPQRHRLTLALGRAHQVWGEVDEAVRIYRDLDLRRPGSDAAAEARAQLVSLEGGEVRIRPLTALQEVDRLERLVRSGPPTLARAELSRVDALPLSRGLRQRWARSAARMARVEGRFDDARRLLRQALGQPGLDAEETQALAEQAADMERAASSRQNAEVRSRIARLLRGPIGRVRTARLFAALRIASRARMPTVVNRVLDALLAHRRLPPVLAFDAGILASGVGDDERVARLFETCVNHRSRGVAARYHRARALERSGHHALARQEFEQVISDDRPNLPYYALWARQRLGVLATAQVSADVSRSPSNSVLCDPAASDPAASDPVTSNSTTGMGKTGGLDNRGTSEINLSHPDEPAEGESNAAPGSTGESSGHASDSATPPSVSATELMPVNAVPDPTLSREQMLELLEEIAETYRESLPWIGRASALIELGEYGAATDELHETYVAFRDARGRGSLNAGLTAVMRGNAPPRHRATGATWRQRRGLGTEARTRLARVAAALGDHGLAIRFGGFETAADRPRAHSELVEAAAQRHGIEPELLFAVMRVESIYNPRIVSYAGAIGLMQIMPRTGRLIANRLGRTDFTVDELLSPATNIEFSAWYLASLLERFEGRLPLAIASYNGGPHNVRRWMENHAADMPLDAFLERIPFSQTHRYVRRVLTHYAAYRAQRQLPPSHLDTELPPPARDTIAF